MTWPTKTDFVDGDVLTAAQVNNIGTNLNLANPTGITDGYVLTADGAGSMGWEPLGASAPYELLATTTNTSTTTTFSYTFSNYQKILVVGVIVNSSNQRVYMTMNNNITNNNYKWVGLYANQGGGTGIWSNHATASYMIAGNTSYSGGKIFAYEFTYNDRQDNWSGQVSSLLDTSSGSGYEGNFGGGEIAFSAVTSMEVVCANRSSSSIAIYGVTR